jgi:hypothetical protein
LRVWQGLLDTILCDKAGQCLAAGWLFSPGTAVTSANTTDRHDIAEILLKMALNTITLSLPLELFAVCVSMPFLVFESSDQLKTAEVVKFFQYNLDNMRYDWYINISNSICPTV